MIQEIYTKYRVKTREHSMMLRQMGNKKYFMQELLRTFIILQRDIGDLVRNVRNTILSNKSKSLSTFCKRTENMIILRAINMC